MMIDTTPAPIHNEQARRPDGLPDKFWDPVQHSVRVDALVQSYRELERKLSQSMPRPQPGSTDEVELFKLFGLPETPDAYEIDTSHGLFGVDPDLNKRLYEARFTARQVQMVYDLAAEKMLPLLLEMAADLVADRELERLVTEFGGPEGWRRVSEQLLAFGRKNLSPEILKGLTSSYEGVMALYAMMKNKTPALPGAGSISAETEEMELRTLMRDPKYWREKDPATVTRVTQGFERLYNTNKT